VGTGGNGLFVWENGGFRQVLAPDQVAQGVRQLVIAKNGLVWFANLSGLYQFDGRTTTRVMASTSTDQAVASLAEGPDGSIWYGTFGGFLRCWRNGTVTSYHPLDKMPANRLWSLFPEADGSVWVGTVNTGLLRFKDGEFVRFTKADGLADNYISHILADNSDNLWLGSSVGVMRVSKKSLNSKGSSAEPMACRLFGRNDGLPTVAMTLEFQPSCVKTHDGTLWFGSPKGASWVRPDDVRAAQPAPNVLVESVLSEHSSREFSKSSVASLIAVKPGEKYLDVSYTAPDFVAPDLLRFKYRLDPLDADWVDAGSRRSVNYSHLPVGEYTFRVAAGNSDGAWNLRGAGFRLVVQPYFWERKSFQVSTVLALVAAVAWAVRRLAHQRLRRRLELLHQQQQVERERVRIAQDLHDDLGAGLTEISLTSDFGRNLKPVANESGEYFHEIGGRARELVQRLDEIVWAVNPRNDSINSMTIYVCEYVQQLLKSPGIACRFDLQPDLPELNLSSEQRYNLFLAFKETVHNVARHSRATELHLRIHTDGQKLCFVVADNGCGFDHAVRSAGADGLRNIRQRIERLGGQCEIASQPGQGTRVSFWIPMIWQPAPA
jgi:signal transduction histidine kinase/streptogramin lyase